MQLIIQSLKQKFQVTFDSPSCVFKHIIGLHKITNGSSSVWVLGENGTEVQFNSKNQKLRMLILQYNNSNMEWLAPKESYLHQLII